MDPSSKAPLPLKLCLNILPIAYIVIGSVYLNECPQQPFIPIYLVVMGVLCVLLTLSSFLPCDPGEGCGRWWYSVMFCILGIGFLGGSVCIYLIYEPNYNKNTTPVSSYCNKTLYLFSFWTTTLVYCLIVLFLFGRCFLYKYNLHQTEEASALLETQRNSHPNRAFQSELESALQNRCSAKAGNSALVSHRK